MNYDEENSSGFIGSDFPEQDMTLTELKPYYASKNGFSQLYICRMQGKLFIIKGLKEAYRSQELYRQLLRKEFRIGSELNHPNIAKIISMEDLPDIGLCFQMEYINGKTLRELINQKAINRRLGYKIIGEICDALRYIHSKQIIHKDLKPENILITNNGQNVKLIDFGLSDSADYDILKLPAGTRKYIAPEQMEKDVFLDNRTDIYSLGIIIKEMNELIHSARLKKIAKHCSQSKREKRYRSVSELKEYLEQKDSSKTAIIVMSIIIALIGAGIAFQMTRKTQPDFIREMQRSDFNAPDSLQLQPLPPDIITEEEFQSSSI